MRRPRVASGVPWTAGRGSHVAGRGMFRRVFVLAAVAGIGFYVARKVGIIGRGDDEDEPIEYAPAPEAPSADDRE